MSRQSGRIVDPETSLYGEIDFLKQRLETAKDVIERRDKMIVELNSKQHTFRDLAGRLLYIVKSAVWLSKKELELISEAEQLLNEGEKADGK